jgi:hypothetical protein
VVRRARGRSRRPARSVPGAPRPPWPSADALDAALAGVDWGAVREDLCRAGASVLPGLLDDAGCAAYAAHCGDDALFERSVEMAPRGYGVGRYRFLHEPLPGPAGLLRERLHAEFTLLARRARGPEDLPGSLAELHARCR